MYLIYTTVLYLLLPFVLLRLMWLGRKNPAYRQRWQERLGLAQPLASNVKLIWIHAVSVGEVHVSRPLVDQLQRHYPDYQILITTVTPTGEAAARQIYGVSLQHRYFPYDLPFAISRFLETFRPSILLILETEIWPNLYRYCQRSAIPILLLNARLSERSFNHYRLIKGLTASTLQGAAVIAAQTPLDADRFKLLGASADQVLVTGNLKFDINIPTGVIEQGRMIRHQFSDHRPVWIAASTHPGEELLILEALAIVLKLIPDSLLIIAPRHPERSRAIYDLCVKKGFQTVCYSNPGAWDPSNRIFILDVLGQLPAYYAAADIAYVGGSLVPVGGHNLLEPACLGLPVISGPHLFNFTGIAKLLDDAEALIRVDNVEQLGQKVVALFADASLRADWGARARQVVEDNQGSIKRVVSLLDNYLERTVSKT
jgi:3-deoxy-D-manno-octulosonic-acid transferase